MLVCRFGDLSIVLLDWLALVFSLIDRIDTVSCV